MSLLDERGSGAISWQRNLAVLWGGVFFACASYTMVVPFLPVFLLQELHVDSNDVNFWSGLVYAITFLGAAIMAPYWGARADKVGQRRMAIRAGFGLAMTYWLAGVSQTPEQLLAVRALTGFISGFVPASMSLVSSTLPESRMGWGMGLMQTAVASGTILGPMMGGYLSAWFGMRMSFFVASLCLAFATLMVVFYVRDIPHASELAKVKINLWQDLKDSLQNKGLIYVMSMFFLVQVCTMLIQPLVTLYVSHLMGRMDESVIKAAGIIFSLAGIAGIIAAPFWGNQGQKRGYTRILSFVLVCAGTINLFQIFIRDIWQFAGIQFIYGLFLSGAVPNINAKLVEVTHPSMRGKAFGLVTSAQQFGGVVGPLLGGALGEFMLTRHILVLTGIILLSTGFYTYQTKVKNTSEA
ncbi:MFS transporter [uncultured Phascolarctobacterium sp.]|uniref:MFS transporter n=1 Tax=uncultured Phascolarctobacterium sp. TaxID=512296 RepID=UPI0027D9BD31|nr:MFS transporter [uncultured Phascolarctobacterium sp.]